MKAKLHFTITNWSGWKTDDKSKSTPIKIVIEVEKGALDQEKLGKGFLHSGLIEVTDIESNSVTFLAHGYFPSTNKLENGGEVKWYKSETGYPITKATLKISQKAEFSTDTRDAGTYFLVKLQEITE